MHALQLMRPTLLDSTSHQRESRCVHLTLLHVDPHHLVMAYPKSLHCTIKKTDASSEPHTSVALSCTHLNQATACMYDFSEVVCRLQHRPAPQGSCSPASSPPAQRASCRRARQLLTQLRRQLPSMPCPLTLLRSGCKAMPHVSPLLSFRTYHPLVLYERCPM